MGWSQTPISLVAYLKSNAKFIFSIHHDAKIFYRWINLIKCEIVFDPPVEFCTRWAQIWSVGWNIYFTKEHFCFHMLYFQDKVKVVIPLNLKSGSFIAMFWVAQNNYPNYRSEHDLEFQGIVTNKSLPVNTKQKNGTNISWKNSFIKPRMQVSKCFSC